MRLHENLTNVYISLIREGLEGGARLFSVISGDIEIYEVPLRHKRTCFFGEAGNG